MFDHYLVTALVTYMHGCSPELLSVFLLFLCIFFLLFFFRFFGVVGLYVYSCLALVLANIQVLKIVPFHYLNEPVALGTILFSTLFLANDIMTEHYGYQSALKNIKLGFLTQIWAVLLFLITLGFSPLPHDPVHDAMTLLFQSSLRLLVASLTAYGISQWIDISLFQWIRQKTHNKHLWLRAHISLLASAVLDNIIFSTLAWVILSPTPISARTLIVTYILGTLSARILIALLSAPVLYLSYIVRKE